MEVPIAKNTYLKIQGSYEFKKKQRRRHFEYTIKQTVLPFSDLPRWQKNHFLHLLV